MSNTTREFRDDPLYDLAHAHSSNAVMAWAARRYEPGDRDPVLSAWEKTGDVLAMQFVLINSGINPVVFSGHIQDLVEHYRSSGCRGVNSQCCVEQFRKIVPVPPTLEQLLATLPDRGEAPC